MKCEGINVGTIKEPENIVFRLFFNCELLGTKFEPFTGRFPDFKRVDGGLKSKVFDCIARVY